MNQRTNPYDCGLADVVGILLTEPSESILQERGAANNIGLAADNEWKYPQLAGKLVELAYVLSRGGGDEKRAAAAFSLVTRLFRKLLEAAVDDRWYHGVRGQGDRNIDAFTLIPLVEAYLLVRERLPRALSETMHKTIVRAIDVWIGHYSVTDPEAYPNMDIRHALLMALGHRLTGSEKWMRECGRYLDLVRSSQFEQGAWTYCKGVNECPAYHDSNVAHLARIHALSGDSRCLSMLRQSVPYYPRVCTPNGFAEYWTDPWWKHLWYPPAPEGPDIVASVTGDPENRRIGDFLRGRRPPRGGLPAVYAAMLWQDVPTGVETKARGVVPDPDILGRRGRFDAWTWAATTRYGSDTVVGAIAHTSPGAFPAALLGVVAEISVAEEGPRGDRRAQGMLPRDVRKEEQPEGDGCVIRLDYCPAAYYSIWEELEPHPHAWECHQIWRLDAHALRGSIVLVAAADQESPPPQIRLKFGRQLKLIERAPGHFECDPFFFSLDAKDFPVQKIVPTTACFFEQTADAIQLVAATDRPMLDFYRAGERFSADIMLSLMSTSTLHV